MIRYRLVESEAFKEWIKGLGDGTAQGRINGRLRRLRRGEPGDHRYISDGVTELRLMFGPGYRVYYTQKDDTVLILLAGGDKSSQQSDIQQAIALAASYKED